MPSLLNTRVAGIPCKVRVTELVRAEPGCRSGHPDNWTEDEPAEVDFEILDRRGRPAPWLERKASDGDISRITSEILETA